MKYLIIALLAVPVVAQEPTQDTAPVVMTAAKDGKTVEIRIGDAPFAVYQTNTKGELPKPFLLPVRAADGTVLTRALKDPEDHPHHKGVWVSVDQVNGVEFWAEKGKILTMSAYVGSTEIGSLRVPQLRVKNSWQSLEGEPIVEEETAIVVHPNRLVTFDIRFTAKHGPVEFGDTKEGLLGFRMVNSLREKETGKVVNANGAEGSAKCWGRPSPWVDYYGTINDKTYGITLFDHPKNLRKSRYHVRNYGLFSISPFGEKAYTKGKEEAKPVKLAKGESLRLRYALYIHDGDTKTGKVADTYKLYLKSTEDKAAK